MAPKIDAKSMKNRGCVFGPFLGGQKCSPASFLGGHLATIFDQNPKKGIKKDMQKSISKKYKVSKINAKSDQK